MKVFYNEYDKKLLEYSITPEEKATIHDAINKTNALVEKNRENIQILAKEIQMNSDEIAESKTRQEAQLKRSMLNFKDIEMNIVEQSQQFRKLSEDLFEAIGLRESENDFENRMTKLKEHYEGVIREISGQLQKTTDELDIPKIKKDLQNFTFTQMNERQEQIASQLMLYMQKLISQQNM